MKKWQKEYPPYEGTEPYVYLAFADADSRKVWPVMKVLLKRGCRVWYCTGAAGNPQELFRRQSRATGAAWTLLYLTDELTADKDTKTRIMVNQKERKTIVCLDPDGVNRYLAMDIRESTTSIPLYRYRNEAELDHALIHAEGYTQDLIGMPVKIKNNWRGKVIGVLLILSMLLFLGSIFAFLKEPIYEDSISFSDSVIREAVRAAVGGGALHEEQLQSIRSIRLTELPENWEDLSLLPALQEIEVPQREALTAEDLPIDAYRIVLYGGAS